MIDFHNHLIPNIDDGSKSIEMSIDMLKKAEKEGTTVVVNTVHFQHPKMDYLNTAHTFILQETDKMRLEIKKHDLSIDLLSSAEIYYQENLCDLINNPLTIIGSKYMLIEFHPLIIPKSYEQVFYNLQIEGITPIIAHPERYVKVQKNIDIAKKWVDKGYILQINCGSLLGSFGIKIKKTAFDLFNNGLCHIVGSDAHNDARRNFCMNDCLEFISGQFGASNKEIIIQNSFNLIDGHNLQSIEPKFIKSNYFFDKISNYIKK
tara:strand:- start:657 stop:1442 length:786 start_codon:yes stop_codon:yes gene_type:complete